MKKTLLALAIPAVLASSSASAVTIYENDATVFSVGGEVEIQYRQTAAEDIANTDGEIRVEDGDLAFDVDYKANDALTVLAGMHLKVGEDDEDSTNTSGYNNNGKVSEDEIFVGIKGDFGKLTVGDKTPFIDDAGIGVDINLKDNGGLTLGETDPYDQLLEYTYSNDGISLGVGYVFAQDDASTDNNDTGKTAEMTELKAGYDFGTVAVTTYYTVQNGLISYTAGDNDNELKSFELDVAVDLDAFYIGAGISSAKLESKDDRLMSYEVAGSYDATEKLTLGLGYAFNDADNENSNVPDGQSSVYGNVQYKLAKNTRAYAEVSFEDTGASTGDSSGTGVALGMEVTF